MCIKRVLYVYYTCTASCVLTCSRTDAAGWTEGIKGEPDSPRERNPTRIVWNTTPRI